MRALISAVLLVLMAGCGGGSDAPTATPTSPSQSSTSASETTTPTPMTLRDVCPQVEEVTPDGMVPRTSAMDDLLASLDALAAASDLETQNAIDLLRPGAQAYRDVLASGKTGLDYLDAEGAYSDGISAFAVRCQAAGSSAFT